MYYPHEILKGVTKTEGIRYPKNMDSHKKMKSSGKGFLVFLRKKGK